MEERLSHEEFVKKAIVSLRKEGFKGIHTVYSGFNEASRSISKGKTRLMQQTALQKKERSLYGL